MKFDWEQIQQAFVDGNITLEQLFSILVDNYGLKRATQIIQENLDRCE